MAAARLERSHGDWRGGQTDSAIHRAPVTETVTPTSAAQRHQMLLAGVFALSIVSLWISELALFAAFLTFLTWVSLPELPTIAKRRFRWALLGVFALSLVGLVRFVADYALRGMLTAAKSSVDKDTVSHLREILFAQDYARQRALLDPDGDGIGSALPLQVLTGADPLAPSNAVILDRRYGTLKSTDVGPAAALQGYLFMICLPTRDGYSAQPAASVDEERAERQFRALAWPDALSVDGASHGKVFSIDAEERILEFDNRQGQSLIYAGVERPPPCNVVELRGRDFVAWQGKRPRDTLPGAP